MKMLISIFPIILSVYIASSATTLSIPCPRSCDCNHVQKNAQERILDIKCFVWDINDVNSRSLSVVQEDFELTLVCDSGIPVELDNNMFSYLPYMKSISFDNCKISYVHRHAFIGVPDLHTIAINSASNLHLQFHPDVFKKVTKLNTLVLTGSGIVKVPTLCNLGDLNVLNVSSNSLVSFETAGINCTGDSALQSLTVIDISNNYFQTVKEMETIGKHCPNVEIFMASDNDIKMSSNENPFSNFKNLRVLSLSRNKISVLPDTLLDANKDIQEISLSANNLQHLPSDIFRQSSRLLQVEIQENSLGDSVWLELADVKNLLYLDLSDNELTFLNQTTITVLPDLLYLNLARNWISHFPVRTFENQQGLKTLNLDGSMIHTLDNEALYGLLSLTRLELQNNRLYSMNQNTFSPVTQLFHLNISHNYLQELPSLDKLLSLKVFDASHNSIEKISEKMFKAHNNIRDINLSDNHITELPDTLFLSCKSLENLDLSNNFIKYIHPSLFFGMNLQKLFLQRNSLQDVGTMFYSLKQLQELNLSSNEITDTIQRLTFPENLVMLDLSYNRIEHIRPFAFVGLDQIRMIDLRYNRVFTLSKESLTVSTGQYAQTGFRINENPLKCDCNLLWLKHWNQATSGPIIVNLNITRCSGAYNYPQSPVKAVPEERFLCKYESVCTSACKCCDFMACDCKYKCPENCECYNSADYLTTHYIKCSNENITAIDKFIPKIATKLDYSGSDLVQLESHSFIGMVNLKSLLLNNSNIKLISNGTFIGLTHLKTLYLNHNLIKTLWKDMFNGLDNLETLYLDNNYISVIQDGVFNHISSMTKLSLTNNFLQYMSDYVSALVFSIKDIELYSNPWTCNCILFFSARGKPRAFINMTAGKSKDASKINCTVHSINGLNQAKALQDYRGICERQTTPTAKLTVSFMEEIASSGEDVNKPNTEESRNQIPENSNGNDVIRQNLDGNIWNDTMKIFIPAIVAATILFIVVLIVLCRREFVKCWFLTKFRGKTDELELLYDKKRFYDAFVAYHPRDELYVIRDLALRLERGEHKYLLQLQHRDCPSGTSVPNYIDSSVKSSHRTIIVLSKDYAADNASLKYVLESVKLDSIRRLIVIVLDKVEKSKLDPVMQTVVKSEKCLQFGERWFWEKLKLCLPEPGKVERDIARAEVHPYACTDLARLSSSMMDNQAYEEPFSVSSLATRPLPAVADYTPPSQSYQYTAGSQQSSNIYEEIKDQENTSLKYAEPWTDSQLQTNVETLSRASKA
ncbi:toll-like receptor Tollo isoform X2 [Mercenaria mercenaria]|nr:toll-like receptor Tollo isoform X2 [Mercenaria mercenaria]